MPPFLTVLMPVYNAEKHLREAIDSVLNQTMPAFEFIIIDDGSTDSSVAIVQSYQDPRIRFYKNEKNSGISFTLNRGIELAETNLIARMDADDICLPNRLERQYAFIQARPEGALFSCWVEEITEEKEPIRIEKYFPYEYFYNLTFAFLQYHPSLVFNRDAVKSIGMYTVPYGEDYELVWQLSRRFKMYHQPEVLLQYRISEQSLWQVTKKKEYKEAVLQQIRRNIRYYYNKPDVEIEDWQIELLGTGAEPENLTTDKAVRCIKLLDTVTERMMNSENVNLVTAEMKSAALLKRERMLLQLYSKLGAGRGSIMLLKTRSYPVLWNLVLRKLKMRK